MMIRVAVSLIVLSLLAPHDVCAQGLSLVLDGGGGVGGETLLRESVPVMRCYEDGHCDAPGSKTVRVRAGGGIAISIGLDAFLFERRGHVAELETTFSLINNTGSGIDGADINYRRTGTSILAFYRYQPAQLRVGAGMVRYGRVRLYDADPVFADYETRFDPALGYSFALGWAHPWAGVDLRYSRASITSRGSASLPRGEQFASWTLGFVLRLTIPLFGRTPCNNPYRTRPGWMHPCTQPSNAPPPPPPDTPIAW